MSKQAKNRKYGVAFRDLAKHLAVVFKLDDPEIMLLRAHLLIERVLVATAAARLREDDHEAVPRMSMSLLIDLAAQGDEERRALIWFNELRNALAHEFGAIDSAHFKRKIKMFEVPWPDSLTSRAVVMKAIVSYVMLVAYSSYLDHTVNQVTLERAPRLSTTAGPFLEQAVRIKTALDTAKESLKLVGAMTSSALEASPPSLALPSL